LLLGQSGGVPVANDYSRIHRLLRLLTLIQSDRGLNAARLAEICQTSPRTIYRDINVLREAGVPCHFDEATGGYRVRGDFFMPPVRLALDESLALIALAEHVGGAGQIPFMHQAARAVEKIWSQLPAKLREEAGELHEHMEIMLAQAMKEDGIGDVYETMRQAILSRRAVRCLYESPLSSEESSRSREPFLFRAYRLFWGQRAWYIIGHHSGHDEVRSLKLSRFTKLEVTNQPYSIPQQFSLNDHLGNAWRMIRGEKRYDIELWFSPEFAETISDTHWHDTQQIDYHEDGSITFRCSVDGLDEIVWWILSMGPHCIVRKPRVLINRVRDLATQTVARYET
jgi:predicted DNA-binding transcriptional regulator YafY